MCTEFTFKNELKKDIFKTKNTFQFFLLALLTSKIINIE